MVHDTRIARIKKQERNISMKRRHQNIAEDLSAAGQNG